MSVNEEPPRTEADLQSVWGVWAYQRIEELKRNVYDSLHAKAVATGEANNAKEKLSECEAAIHGLEAAIKAKKTVVCFEPGTSVLVGPKNERGVIEQTIISRTTVAYLVSWWVGAIRAQDTFLLEDLKEPEDLLRPIPLIERVQP